MSAPLPIEVLFDESTIRARVATLATEIAAAMPAETLVVAVLKGSFVFVADLIRALTEAGLDTEMDFITLASYGTATESSGKVRVVRDITEDVRGRSVLIIDDIFESGRTLAYARALLLERGAAEVRLCTLLDKPHKRVVDLDPDFTGFTVPDQFVVGYGLDYAHRYRGLPFIGVLQAETA